MLIPYGKNIIVKRIGESTKTQRGAIRTASIAEKPVLVEVVASNHQDFNPGDRVVIRKYAGNEYEYNGEEIVFITPEDVLAREGGE